MIENENFTLRKRVTTNEKDTDLNTRKVVKYPIVVNTLIDEWELFKDDMMTKFPSVSFPNEYCDTERITASVMGMNADITLVIQRCPPNVLFSVQQDGRLLVEFTKPTSTPSPRSRPFEWNRIYTVLALWVLSLLLLIIFIKSNYEKYMILLSI